MNPWTAAFLAQDKKVKKRQQNTCVLLAVAVGVGSLRMGRTKNTQRKGKRVRGGIKHKGGNQTASAEPRGDLKRSRETAEHSRSPLAPRTGRYTPAKGAPAPSAPCGGAPPLRGLSLEVQEYLVRYKIPVTLVISRRTGQFDNPYPQGPPISLRPPQ